MSNRNQNRLNKELKAKRKVARVYRQIVHPVPPAAAAEDVGQPSTVTKRVTWSERFLLNYYDDDVESLPTWFDKSPHEVAFLQYGKLHVMEVSTLQNTGLSWAKVNHSEKEWDPEWSKRTRQLNLVSLFPKRCKIFNE